jgi:hypothetical protein
MIRLGMMELVTWILVLLMVSLPLSILVMNWSMMMTMKACLQWMLIWQRNVLLLRLVYTMGPPVETGLLFPTACLRNVHPLTQLKYVE